LPAADLKSKNPKIQKPKNPKTYGPYGPKTNGPFWVLANTKTQKVTLIILIIFSHLGAKFLGFWILG
jgi:hypothetical protein